MLVGPEDWQTENLLPVTEKYIALWQGFPNSGKGGGEIFLLDEGNLMRSDFDDSNLFQS